MKCKVPNTSIQHVRMSNMNYLFYFDFAIRQCRRSTDFGLSVRPPCQCVRSFVRPRQMFLPRYLMNGLNDFDETYRENIQ